MRRDVAGRSGDAGGDAPPGRLYGAIILLVCLITTAASAQPGPTQDVYWEADRQENRTLGDGTIIIEMTGLNGRQGDVTIVADRGVYNQRTKQAELRGNVTVSQPGTSLSASAIDYSGASGVAITPSGSTIRDGTATITAGYAEYYTNRRSALFRNGVTMTDEGTRLEAGSGTYSSVTRIGDFAGGVRVTNDSGTLDATTLRFNRATDESQARGNVRLFSRQDSTLLEADFLDHRPNVETRALGNVRLTSYRDSTLLLTDTLYDYPGRETLAIGGVELRSEPDRATLTGDRMQHVEAEERTVITGSPLLVQTDSSLTPYREATTGPDDTLATDSGAETIDTLEDGDLAAPELVTIDDSLFVVERDTTRITADTLERIALGEKTFIARGSARIGRGDLTASAEVLHLFEDRDLVTLGRGDVVPLSNDSATAGEGDGIDGSEGTDEGIDEVTDGETSDEIPDDLSDDLPDDAPASDTSDVIAADEPALPSRPILWYESTQMTGDSVTVTLEEGKVRTIDALGDAMMIDATDTENRYNQLAAEQLLFTVEDGQLSAVDAVESAASMYFVFDESRPDGVDISSADLIEIRFEGGDLATILWDGPRSRVSGETLPESDVAGNESRFRLDGFTLYPRPDLVAIASGTADAATTDTDSQTDESDATDPDGGSE